MMTTTRTLALALALLAFVAPPVGAQFAAQAPMTVSILDGYELVGKINATPHRAGDDLLYRNKLWKHVVLVVVPNHPTKSGTNGMVPAPGVCIESVQAFTIFDPVLTIADVNGDGVDDVVGVSGGQTQVLTGLGAQSCR